MIAHIVLFTPKSTGSAEEHRSFASAVVSEIRSIDSVRRAIIGRMVDVDPGYTRSMGDTTYEFAAVLEFEDRAALVTYLRDPRHQELGRLFWENCERTVVSEVECLEVGDQGLTTFLTEGIS